MRLYPLPMVALLLLCAVPSTAQDETPTWVTRSISALSDCEVLGRLPVAGAALPQGFVVDNPTGLPISVAPIDDAEGDARIYGGDIRGHFILCGLTYTGTDSKALFDASVRWLDAHKWPKTEPKVQEIRGEDIRIDWGSVHDLARAFVTLRKREGISYLQVEVRSIVVQ